MKFLPPDLVRIESFDWTACDVSAAAAVTRDTPGAQVHAPLSEHQSETLQHEETQLGVELSITTEADIHSAVSP